MAGSEEIKIKEDCTSLVILQNASLLLENLGLKARMLQQDIAQARTQKLIAYQQLAEEHGIPKEDVRDYRIDLEKGAFVRNEEPEAPTEESPEEEKPDK